MQMMDRLASILAGVDHNAISLLELLRAGKVRGRLHEMSQERLLVCKRAG